MNRLGKMVAFHLPELLRVRISVFIIIIIIIIIIIFEIRRCESTRTNHKHSSHNWLSG